MVEAKNIGYAVVGPKDSCNDRRCPFHGNLKVHGKVIAGTVVSVDLHSTAVIEEERRVFIRKFERYAKKRSRIHVHNPKCINAVVGDRVKAMECRQLSKTKNFVIVEKLGHDILLKEKLKDLMEEEKKSFKRKHADDKAAEES